MSSLHRTFLPLVAAPLLLAACPDPEASPATPLPAVGVVEGDNIVRVIPGLADSVLTVHGEEDGVYLQESTLTGAPVSRVLVDADPGAAGRLRVVPGAQRGAVIAYPKDDYLVVRQIRAGLDWTIGTVVAPAGAFQLVGVSERGEDSADVYALADAGDGHRDLVRFHFPAGSADVVPETVYSLAGADVPAREVVGLDAERFAVLLDDGAGEQGLHLLDRSGDTPSAVDSGPLSETRLLGADAEAVYAQSSIDAGQRNLFRFGRAGWQELVLSAETVAVDLDATRVSQIVSDPEVGYSLVESTGELDDLRVGPAFWLGASEGLRIDELHILAHDHRAVLGVRNGIAGLFLFDLSPAATE